MINRLLALALALCAPYCATLNAAEHEDERYRLQQIRMLSQATLSDFYLLYGVDQDPALFKAMQQRIQAVNALFSTLNQPTARDSLAQLEALWQAYAQRLAQFNEALRRNVSLSPRDITELLGLNQQLLEHCDALSRQLPASDRAPLNQQLSLQLQNLSSHYIAYSIGANSLGGEETEIDQLARDFDTRLDELQTLAGSHPQNQAILANIQRKWRFIEAPLHHYSRRASVPFLVNQNAGRIIQLLAQLHTPATDSNLRQL
jgi:hypothetical protein